MPRQPAFGTPYGKLIAAVSVMTIAFGFATGPGMLTAAAHVSPINALTSVACPSAVECFAVGFSGHWHGSYRTLIERWDGVSWSVVPSPNPAATPHVTLHAVTCVDAAMCFAVGASEDHVGASSDRTLVEGWNGAAWSIVPSPNPAGGGAADLLGIACVSAISCMASGTYAQPNILPLLEHWDGISWTITPGPTIGGYSALGSVTCMPHAGECMAVGLSSSGGGSTVPLAYLWDGRSWSIESTPVPLASTGAGLEGISCDGRTMCVAAGWSYDALQDQSPLIETWNGSRWTIVPNVPALPMSGLDDVSCRSAVDCTAVGGYYVAIRIQLTLVEHWNGVAWLIEPSPSPVLGSDSSLHGVSCLRATPCFAVGTSGQGYATAAAYNTLVERRVVAWVVTPSPNAR